MTDVNQILEGAYNRLPVRFRPAAKRAYRLVSGGDDTPRSHRKSIGHAVGSTLSAWRRDDSNPVIEPSPRNDDWDGFTVEDPDVIRDDGFLMAYAGHGEYDWETKQIGIARREDGGAWSKAQHNPVLSPGPDGSWDDRSVQNPTLVQFDGAYHMIYDGSKRGYGWNGLGYAWSRDGRHWEKHEANPVLPLGDENDWDSQHIADPHLLHDGDQFHLFYAGMGAENWQIGHATSDNLVDWKRDRENPVVELENRSNWEYFHVNDPTVIEYDGRYHMLHAGHSEEVKRFEHAVSDDLSTWESSRRPAFEPDPTEAWEGQRLTNPSLVAMDDTLHLYYTGQKQSP